MNLFKVFMAKLGHYLLTFMGILRRALCCLRRRRRMSDSSLPMTTNDLVIKPRYSTLDQNGSDTMQSWDTWTDGESMSIQVDSSQQTRPNNKFERSTSTEERKSDDDVEELFKDMMPTIRRPKKYIVKSNMNEDGQIFNPSSRLAVDIKATSTVFHQTPDLGVIDDHVETWEDSAASEELWSSESALREQKMAERERRLADHQRRKQEREQGRSSRSNSIKLS